MRGRNVNRSVLNRRQNGTKKESITPVREGKTPPREGKDEGVINPSANATGGVDQRRRTISR